MPRAFDLIQTQSRLILLPLFLCTLPICVKLSHSCFLVLLALLCLSRDGLFIFQEGPLVNVLVGRLRRRHDPKRVRWVPLYVCGRYIGTIVDSTAMLVSTTGFNLFVALGSSSAWVLADQVVFVTAICNIRPMKEYS